MYQHAAATALAKMDHFPAKIDTTGLSEIFAQIFEAEISKGKTGSITVS